MRIRTLVATAVIATVSFVTLPIASSSAATPVAWRTSLDDAVLDDTPRLQSTPDGGTVVLTQVTVAGLQQPAISKITANGTRDRNFGNDGTTLPFADVISTNSFHPSLAVQPDGNILVMTAWHTVGADHQVLKRLTPSGALDSDFGTQGSFTLTSERDLRSPRHIVVMPNGDIQTITSTISGPTGAATAFVSSRVKSNGQPDETFAPGGTKFVEDGVTAYPHLKFATARDNSVYAVGNSFDATHINTDGSVDKTFGTAGKAAFDVITSGLRSIATSSLAVDSQNRLVVGGGGLGAVEYRDNSHATFEHSEAGLVGRFTKNGLPDASFGGSRGDNANLAVNIPGVQVIQRRYETGTQGASRVMALTVDSSDRIIATTHRGSDHYAAMRLLTDSSDDPTFGDNGTILVRDSNSFMTPRSVIVGESGNVLVATQYSNTTKYELVALRDAPVPPTTTSTTSPKAVNDQSTVNPAYAIFRSDGRVRGFGDGATTSQSAVTHDESYISGSSIPGSNGSLLTTARGQVLARGGAPFLGDLSWLSLNRPIVGIAATPTGQGYWMVASDGGVFSFGDAQFFGSTGSMRLNQPIVGIASTPTGMGYWLVAADGGIFTFGDADFHGSTGAMRLNSPVLGMAPSNSGDGYWLVAADGGIFTFGDADFYGSTGSMRLNQPVVGMAVAPQEGGYWLVARDGGVFTFGKAPFLGSEVGRGNNVTAMGVTRNALPTP